jgi:hypothetical protein
VVGGVIGPVDTPQVLIVGRHDDDGQLQVAGRTTDLSPTAQSALGTALRRHSGPGHPWPATLPRSRWGRRPAEPLVYTRVHPDVVVESVVDPATEPPRCVRRLDLLRRWSHDRSGSALPAGAA